MVCAFLTEFQYIFQVNEWNYMLIFKPCVLSLAQVVCFVFTSAVDSSSVRADVGTDVREYYIKCDQKLCIRNKTKVFSPYCNVPLCRKMHLL